jgi:2',3'-cyclic-nucleotide 2'-phosphodiesterase (5'-nucleotidase family)
LKNKQLYVGISNASPVDGEELFPILMNVPFDAMAIGNHECYGGDTINAMITTNYISSRKGTYLTSNVLLSSTMQPLGSRYTVLTGANSGVKLLVFGMLYNMNDHTDVVSVETVESTMASEWFLTALKTEKYDAVAVLFHVDYRDPLITTVLTGIRDVIGDKVPIQFLTGMHTQVRVVFRKVHAQLINSPNRVFVLADFCTHDILI